MREDQRFVASMDPEESILERVDGAQLDRVNGGVCDPIVGVPPDVQSLITFVCQHA